MDALSEYDWCSFADNPDSTEQLWHLVAQKSATTVCGLPVADPDQEDRWLDVLGNHRPCDNCTEIVARKVD